MVKGLDISKAQGQTPTTCNSFYENLHSLCNKHNYLPDHIWNCNEIGIHAGRQFGAQSLQKGEHNKSTTQYQNKGNG
jgi:hypothetical protein